MQTYTFDVQGMTCGHCSARVRDALQKIEGARDVVVDHDADMARVSVDDATALDELIDAIEFSGYDAQLRSGAREPGDAEPEEAIELIEVEDALEVPSDALMERFDIEGMTCASCVARVERALGDVQGVELARVNYATERAEIVLAPDASLDVDAITRAAIDAVEAAGYAAVHHGALSLIHISEPTRPY